MQVQLVDGKAYTSFPEKKVEVVPPIKSLGYQSLRIPFEGEANDASGVQIIVDIDDPTRIISIISETQKPPMYWKLN